MLSVPSQRKTKELLSGDESMDAGQNKTTDDHGKDKSHSAIYGDSWKEVTGKTQCVGGKRVEINQDQKQELIRCTKVGDTGNGV